MINEFYLWRGIGEDADILQQAYSRDNYKIIYTGNQTGRALLCFSGNGLYFLNNYETFSKFISSDRYEWENVIKSDKIRTYYEIIILFRDIYKQWYVTGINKELCNVDKVVDRISNILCGKKFEITTLGNSAGGYASVLFGIKLHASRIFCFSGQFNLFDEIYRDGKIVAPFLDYYKMSNEINYNLIPILKQTEIPVYYFFPAYCEWDKKEYDLIKDYSRLIPYPIKNINHGVTIWGNTYAKVLSISDECLLSYSKTYPISAFSFARNFFSFTYCLKYVLKKYIKQIYEKCKIIRCNPPRWWSRS